MRHDAGATAASPAATSANGAPCARATVAASEALTTWWAPRTASAIGPLPHGVESRNVGRRSASSTTSVARTSAPAGAVRRRSGRWRRCGPRDRASPGRRRRAPRCRWRGAPRAARPSPAPRPRGRRVIRVREPDVGDDADGRARHRAERGDVAGGPRPHLEHQRLGAARCARATSAGLRPRCCRNPGSRGRRTSDASAAAVRSLVPVLPAEPVMPTTTTSPSAARGGAAEIGQRAEGVVDAHDRGALGRVVVAVVGDERDARAARERVGDEVVTVALGHERDEARAGPDHARVDGERRGARVGGAPVRVPPVRAARSAALNSIRAPPAPRARRRGRRRAPCAGARRSDRSRAPCRRAPPRRRAPPPARASAMAARRSSSTRTSRCVGEAGEHRVGDGLRVLRAGVVGGEDGDVGPGRHGLRP